MYTYLTTYDTDRHLASLCRQGTFEGHISRRPVRQWHPARRVRHALAGLARHTAITPASPVLRFA